MTMENAQAIAETVFHWKRRAEVAEAEVGRLRIEMERIEFRANGDIRQIAREALGMKASTELKISHARFRCRTCGQSKVWFVVGKDPRSAAIESGWKLDKHSDGGVEYYGYSGHCPAHAEGPK